jgi:putative alpha-1,2-mannosidase
MKLNGKVYTKNYLTHEDLMKGAVINFTMSASPDKKRGIDKTDFPYSFSNEK